MAKLVTLGVLVWLVFRAKRGHEWIAAALWVIAGFYLAAVFGNVLVWRAT